MKKTAELISLGARVEAKYSITKTANPNNLSYKLMDIVQFILDKKKEPSYQEEGVQMAMSNAMRAMNSLIMELTHGSLLGGNPVEVNTYEDED